MALSFVKEMPKGAVAIDPTDRARTKFVAGVTEQIALSKDVNYTVERTRYVDGEKTTYQKPPRKWWRLVGNQIFIPVKYGNRVLELKGGSIAVTDKGGLTSTLEAIKAEGEKGAFDKAITKAAVRQPRK